MQCLPLVVVSEEELCFLVAKVGADELVVDISDGHPHTLKVEQGVIALLGEDVACDGVAVLGRLPVRRLLHHLN